MSSAADARGAPTSGRASHVSRAPRQLTQRPALCRVVNTRVCWATKITDYSLTGARLAGLPPASQLEQSAELELIEGLENQQIQDLAPILLGGSLEDLETYFQRLIRSHEFRYSVGSICRVMAEQNEFAIAFKKVKFEGRSYPRAQQLQPQMRGVFTFEEGKGRLVCRGKFTPGAAIDLARDVVRDVRQCMLMLDLRPVREYSRISAEKFGNRLRAELTEQDLSSALALVIPEDWPQDDFPELQIFLVPDAALAVLTMPAFERAEEDEQPPEEAAASASEDAEGMGEVSDGTGEDASKDTEAGIEDL